MVKTANFILYIFTHARTQWDLVVKGKFCFWQHFCDSSRLERAQLSTHSGMDGVLPLRAVDAPQLRGSVTATRYSLRGSHDTGENDLYDSVCTKLRNGQNEAVALEIRAGGPLGSNYQQGARGALGGCQCSFSWFRCCHLGNTLGGFSSKLFHTYRVFFSVTCICLL